MKRISTRVIAQTAILTALAVVFGFIENMVPPITSVPGVKPGIGNIAVTVALYLMGWKHAFLISMLKVFLCAASFSGFSAFIYSVSGALFSFMAMLLLKKTGRFSIIGVSAAGGVMHNAGQLAVAYFIIGQGAAAMLPVLMMSGMITGILTGTASMIVVKRGAILFDK